MRADAEMEKRAPDDLIYTSHALRTIPHRIRVRQVIAELRGMVSGEFTYADVGCGGGSITHRIVREVHPAKAFAFDCNTGLIDFASRIFPGISFHVWDLTKPNLRNGSYDLVTCLETLEHVEDLKAALRNLLAMTRKSLLITVPIELGVLGAAKFSAKAVMGKALTEEHSGSRADYLRTLLTGGDISRFRVRSHNGRWLSHSGFDYRQIDRALESHGVNFVAKNRGWNRFYRVTKG